MVSVFAIMSLKELLANPKNARITAVEMDNVMMELVSVKLSGRVPPVKSRNAQRIAQIMENV